jgi:hypothetical protein
MNITRREPTQAPVIDPDAIIVAMGRHCAIAAEHGVEAGVRDACNALIGAVAFIETERGKARARAVLEAALRSVQSG